jgi:hypothetical protein
MAIPPTDVQILFTNYDIIAYLLNLASCSEHYISIKHRILVTFNINKKKNPNPNSAKGPDKGKIVNKLYCILLTTLEFFLIIFFSKKTDMRCIRQTSEKKQTYN